MGTTFKRLGQASLVLGSGASVTAYTVPAATKAQISLITITTIAAATVDIGVFHVASGGSISNDLNLIKRIPGVTQSTVAITNAQFISVEFGRGLIMEAGDTIRVRDNGGSGLGSGSITISGVEIA